MQIVIDVPEVFYEALRKTYRIVGGQRSDKTLMSAIYNAVANGTPLPKVHWRLIEDTPELERELWTYTRYTGIDEAPYESAIKVIDEAPTIIGACTLADADGGDAE